MQAEGDGGQDEGGDRMGQRGWDNSPSHSKESSTSAAEQNDYRGSRFPNWVTRRIDTTWRYVSFPFGIFSNCNVTPNNNPKVKLSRHNHELWLHGCCCCLVAKSGLTQPARLLCPWGFPGKNTAVGCHFLLQGIFLTQGSNSSLLHWQVDSLPLGHPKRFYLLANISKRQSKRIQKQMF